MLVLDDGRELWLTEIPRNTLERAKLKAIVDIWSAALNVQITVATALQSWWAG